MTASQAGGAGRLSTGLARSTTAGAAAPALLILLLLGLGLRLTIAYVLLPGSGFSSDIGTFAAWANRLADVGPGQFYAPNYFVDYPPGYLYVLWLVGALGKVLNPASGVSALIKLPPMLADIGAAFVIFHIVRGWFGKNARADRLALIAAAIYLFNPVTWYDSAVWGQTDGVGALVILLGVAALIRGNSEGAFAMAVLAALVKPQFGVVLGPLVVVVLIKRHLLAPGSGPQHRPWVPAALRPWFEEEHGIFRLVSSLTVGMLLVYALIVPFNLDLRGLLDLFGSAAGGYPFLTINAYNGWALIGSNGAAPLAFGGFWNGSPDTVPLIGPLTGVVIGAVLLVAGYLVALVRVAWRDDTRSILIVTAFLALAFFMLPTRVHERYLFPVYAVLPVLAVVNRRLLWITILLSIGSFINLHGVLTTPLYATDNLKDLPLGELFREPLGVVTSVVLQLTGFVLIALELRPSRVLAEADQTAPADAIAVGRPAVDRPAGAGIPIAGSIAAAGAFEGRRLLDDLRSFVRPVTSVLPLRRDRSTELATETPSRLTRIDVVLVVLLFLAALGLRTFRLEQPFNMHFDEVYHARTATEFLQDWRYGIPHSIYEYTHPHLAKYLIAEGITFFGDDRVVATDDVGSSVNAVAIEPRWEPPGEEATAHDGDRLYVATASNVRVYDLSTNAQVGTIEVVADALAVDSTNHALLLADASGNLLKVQTADFDALRGSAAGASAAAGSSSGPLSESAQPFGKLANLTGRLTSLTYSNNHLIAITDASEVIGIDPATGAETGRTQLAGASAAVVSDAGQRLVVDMSQVTDLESLVNSLAGITGNDVNQLRAKLAGRTGRVTLQGYLGESDVAQKVTDANLAGVTVESGQAVAVATPTGISFVDAETFDPLTSVRTDGAITGFAYVDRAVDKPTLYAAMGNQVQLIHVPGGDMPSIGDKIPMPNNITQVLFNPATELVHALGRTPDGSGWTVYVIEPHANAVFEDAPLSFEPSTIVMDTQPSRPADNRNHIRAYSATGAVATIDAGSNQFGWRFMGVIAGALMAACLYLLARFLFRRRSIAVFAGLLILLDGMAFANARIAMNDTYVAFFSVAAVTVFTPIYLGRWRNPAVVGSGIVFVGVLLGLALASKWVGAYAMGGIVLLVLLRSQLGRLIALMGMVTLTAVLGYIAIQPDGNGSTASANITFLVMMIGLTCLLAVALALRPTHMSKDEFRFVVLGPVVLGALLLVGGVVRILLGPTDPGAILTPTRLLAGGAVLVVLGAIAYLVGRLAANFGIGPLAVPRAVENGEEPVSPAPTSGWLKPGGGLLGLPWVATLGCLIVLPLVIYVLSYIPWINLGNRWTDDYPPGNHGQTFIQLQLSMYDYHNNLRATHPASSPWWAWPFDLKPVWFQQGGYDAGTASSIYDSGNVVIFWLAIPAFIFLCWQAWKRRSLSLALVALMVLSLWLPWVRIDRATFQYHWFTTLPFVILGLAYFLGELWHGPSPRTWLLARVSAAIAILTPALLWILRQPLCGLAGTQRVNPNSEACGSTARQLALTDLQLFGIGVALVAVVVMAWLIWAPMQNRWLARNRQVVLPLVLVGLLGGLMIALVGAMIPGTEAFQMSVGLFELPLLLVVLAVLAVPAYYVLRARDARRFAISVMVMAALWFVLFYPNFSGLPVPSTVLNLVNNALSPTYNWAFQFAVNQAPPSKGAVDWTQVGLLAGVLLILVAAAYYAARSFRNQRAEERSLGMASEAG